MRLPAEIVSRLRRLEWDNRANLRARLCGERAFPISIPLGSFNAGQARDQADRFHGFQRAWRGFKFGKVIWKTHRFNELGVQDIPTRLEIRTFSEFAEILGQDVVDELERWETILAPTVEASSEFYRPLLQLAPFTEGMSPDLVTAALAVARQLRKGLGRGLYPRGLPISGVDTKFLENQEPVLTILLDVLHGGEVSREGGLFPWLGCEDVPANWLTIRCLCPELALLLGGQALLQLPPDAVRVLDIDASHLLIIENLQSLFVPETMLGVLAIGGCGRNLSWLSNCAWARRAACGYWGDIDSWGFQMLSDARLRHPGITSLLMDEDTYLRHIKYAVMEPSPSTSEKPGLTKTEAGFLARLQNLEWRLTRLEQERLHIDFVKQAFVTWRSLH